jgi:hypothetical protein
MENSIQYSIVIRTKEGDEWNTFFNSNSETYPENDDQAIEKAKQQVKNFNTQNEQSDLDLFPVDLVDVLKHETTISSIINKT